MSLVEVTTPFGHAAPPAAGHSAEYSITMHMPLWQSALDLSDQKPELFERLQNMYPRFKPGREVQELAGSIANRAGFQGQACLLFSSYEAASQCRQFAISQRLKEDACSPMQVTVHCYQLKDQIYATVMPSDKLKLAAIPFWQHAGPDMSARQAIANQPYVDALQEVSSESTTLDIAEDPVYAQIRQRIASLLERSAIGSPRTLVVPGDIYLFQTGMAALFYLRQWLPRLRAGTSILLGYCFTSTMQLILEQSDSPHKFFPLGTELDELETFVRTENSQKRLIQAIYCEFPANPMLTTPDLTRLRAIADRYNILLVVDDTIGSFANLDLMGEDGADVLWTSLTKSFSGYSDVMAGSVALNPCTRHYGDLKALFSEVYHNDLYVDDARVLEINSRDYLSRSSVLNANAHTLATMLQACAESPSSTVSKIFYPPFLPTCSYYSPRMRRADQGFTPGYGCLFTLEFQTIEATVAFYDVIGTYIHVGPHLGAHITLVMPYVKALYGKKLQEVATAGLNERQLRFSAGLEDTKMLLAACAKALEAADATGKS